MRRGSLPSSLARRGSLSPGGKERRVGFTDERANRRPSVNDSGGGGDERPASPLSQEVQPPDQAAVAVVDPLSAAIGHTLECRDAILSLIVSELGGVTSMVREADLLPSYIYPRDHFDRYDLSSETLRTLERGIVADMKSQIAQLEVDSRARDAEIAAARRQLDDVKVAFSEALMRAPRSPRDVDDAPPPAPPRPTLGVSRQQRPSFIQARETERAEAWARWTGNLPVPPNAMHLLRPDERGVDFAKANQSPLQLLSIAFKPRVWQEEDAFGGPGKAKEKTIAEEIKYDALRRRHKSLHGADLASLELGDFALSFPDLARSIPVLQVLPDEAIEALDERIEPRDYRENEMIVRQGQEIDVVFFIGAGCVTCAQNVQSPVSGIKTATHTLSKGDFFGNASAAVGTYTATGHVLIFVVERTVLQAVMVQHGASRLEEEFVPSFDEASVVMHVEQFLQYLLMFDGDKHKTGAAPDTEGLSLPGGERLGGRPKMTRGSIRQGGRANRGGSLSTRQTISQFLLPDRHSVAEDAISDVETKKSLMFEMLSCSSPEFDTVETIDNLIRLTKDFFQADRVGLFRINKMKSTMSLRRSQMEDDAEVDVPLRGIAGHIACTGKMLNLPDCYESDLFDPSMDAKTGYRTSQMLCVPAFSEPGVVAGVLQCINTADGQPFSKSDETLCFMVAQQLGRPLSVLLDKQALSNVTPIHGLRDQELRIKLGAVVFAFPKQCRDCECTVSIVHGTTTHPLVHTTKRFPISAAGTASNKAGKENSNARQDASTVASSSSKGAPECRECSFEETVVSFPLRDLPLASRLILQFSCRGKPLAWAGLAVFNFERLLRTGPLTLNLWDGPAPALTAALEKNSGRGLEPCFATIELLPVGCTVVYEVPHQAVKRGPDAHSALELLHGSLSSQADGSSKGLTWFVEQMEGPERARFFELCHAPPATVKLTAGDRDTLWRLRRVLCSKPLLLPLFLLAVDWLHLESVSEAYRLLHQWTPPGRFTALQMLGGRFPDPKVRAYAVAIVAQCGEDEFGEMVVPLVQQLRFEASHDNALARLLLRRALDSPLTIGHAFYWQLQSNAHHPELSSFHFYSSLYARCCGDAQRSALGHTKLLLLLLSQVAKEVQKEKKAALRLPLLHRLLRQARERLPAIFQHPCSPAHRVKGFVTAACYVMESSPSKTLYLVLENAVRGGRPFAVLFKTGFDPREELLSAQLLRTMDALLQDADRDLSHLTSEMPLTGSSARLAGADGLQSSAEALREMEAKAGALNLLLPHGRSIALADSCLYEIPLDAASISAVAAQVELAARVGGGETTRGADVSAAATSPKLLGRTFPNDFLLNWFKLCNLDPLKSHAGKSGAGPRCIPAAAEARLGEALPERGGGGGAARLGGRRKAFSGPSSLTLPGAPNAPPTFAINPVHQAWRARLARSLAGFYLSSCVLGMTGRSADNVLVRASGAVITIEPCVLRVALDGVKKPARREPVPLLPALVLALGGQESARYKEFEGLVLGGFLILRRYVATLTNVLEVVMGGSEVPPEVVLTALACLRENLFVDAGSDDDARRAFRSLMIADRAEFSSCAGPDTYPAPEMPQDGWLSSFA